MQQPPQMIPVMPSYPTANITTEQIQKYLDENKKLILAILDNQNLRKLAECAPNQAQLQKNLMYLTAIADAQPQALTMLPQMAPHPAMQQGAYYMQDPLAAAAAAMGQQSGIFSPKMPLQFNIFHQIADPKQLHQAAIQGQMGMRPIGAINGMHPMHSETTLGSGGLSASAGANDVHGGSNQDPPEAGASGAEGQGNSGAGHGGGDDAK